MEVGVGRALDARKGNASGDVTVIQLVDLAGAERLRETRAAGATLSEACAVNSSLAALSECVAAIVAGAAHIPFRNSRLTRVLEPSLTRTARCLVVLTASMATAHKDAGAATLRFGATLAGTRVGRPEPAEVEAALERFLNKGVEIDE